MNTEPTDLEEAGINYANSIHGKRNQYTEPEFSYTSRDFIAGVIYWQSKQTVQTELDLFNIDGNPLTLLQIDNLLREYYSANSYNRGSGFGRRVIEKIILQVADAQRKIYSFKYNNRIFKTKKR